MLNEQSPLKLTYVTWKRLHHRFSSFWKHPTAVKTATALEPAEKLWRFSKASGKALVAL